MGMRQDAPVIEAIVSPAFCEIIPLGKPRFSFDIRPFLYYHFLLYKKAEMLLILNSADLCDLCVLCG